MILDITPDGYIDIFQREAIVLVPYHDGIFRTGPRKGTIKWSQAGGSQWNHTLKREVREDDPPIEIPEAVAWMRGAVVERLVTINKALKVDITPHQATALHSLFYQSGSKALKRVAGLFNEGRSKAAMLAFAEFPFGEDGIQTEGHSGRRLDEMAIAKSGFYGEQSKIQLYRTDPRVPGAGEWIEASEIAAIIRELDPTRAE